MRFPTLRRAVLEAAQRLSAWGLNQGSSGNVSLRIEGGMFITASGVPWEAISLDDIVEVRMDGRAPSAQRRPSSEWQLHRDLYLDRPELGAIVHTHSRFCTTLSCLRVPLPAVHYMIAVTGANVVRCAEYATFGTAELSRNVVAAMKNSKASLLASHGMVAGGASLDEALRIAREVEIVAEHYWRALQVGTPIILDDAEMQRVHERFRTYGKATSRD